MRKILNFLSIAMIVIFLAYFVHGQVHHIKLVQNGKDFSCLLLEQDTVRKFRGFETQDDKELYIKIQPVIHETLDSPLRSLPEKQSKLIEIFSKNQLVLESQVDTLCKSVKNLPQLTAKQAGEPEIVKIVDGGDQLNRIDVVFMGDGYTASEQDQFFDDIRRLTKEMFEGVTFRSYLPVFNIWAVYVQSQESGIGYDGWKNTPFKLYRQAGQLRGIYTGDANYARQVCRMTGLSGCDYPSLIGNDDFYGGLGGEFVISTKSNRTGTVVLRHEMGHNFIDVGEEYDNGGVYRGANSARSVETLGWTHWLSDTNGPARAERATYRLLEYPWADLVVEGPQTFNFTSDGLYSRFYISVSVSSAGEEDCLEFILDGQVLPWTSSGFDDREFYDWYGDEGLTLGSHSFSVRSKTPPTNDQIPRMICSIRIHEFGNENEFHIDNSYVSAYPTFGSGGSVTYRPTNAGCLMRNMTHNEFCNVCREGMWFQFLERISLIDGITVSGLPNPDGTKRVLLRTLPLAHFRQPGNEVEGEKLETKWFLGGQEQVAHRDLFEIDAEPGSWTVQVLFITPEVRSDPQELLKETEAFIVI